MAVDSLGLWVFSNISRFVIFCEIVHTSWDKLIYFLHIIVLFSHVVYLNESDNVWVFVYKVLYVLLWDHQWENAQFCPSETQFGFEDRHSPNDETSTFFLSSDISITIGLIFLYSAYLWYITKHPFCWICLTLTWPCPKILTLNNFNCAKIPSYYIHKHLSQA